MNNRRGRITGSILAVLAATVVACGSIQGAAGSLDAQPQGDANYLTADNSHDVGPLQTDIHRGYPPQEQDVPEFLQLLREGAERGSSVPAEAPADGYCPYGWCPSLEP